MTKTSKCLSIWEERDRQGLQAACNVCFIESDLSPKDNLCVSHSAGVEKDQQRLRNGHSLYSKEKGYSQVCESPKPWGTEGQFNRFPEEAY